MKNYFSFFKNKARSYLVIALAFITIPLSAEERCCTCCCEPESQREEICRDENEEFKKELALLFDPSIKAAQVGLGIFMILAAPIGCYLEAEHDATHKYGRSENYPFALIGYTSWYMLKAESYAFIKTATLGCFCRGLAWDERW